MHAIRLLLCRLIGHCSMPGTDPRRALVYHCARCHRLVDGGMSITRMRTY
jgi:hypothetical protein